MKENFFKSKTFIILIITLLTLAVFIPVGYILYLDWSNSPNFASPDKNFVSVSETRANPGDTIIYRITITNEGRKTATGIHITTDIPQDTKLAKGEIPYLEDAGEDKIYFLVGSLEPGQKKVLEYAVIIDTPLDDGTTINNNTFSIEYSRKGSTETINKKFEIGLETSVESSIDFSKSYYRITDENGGDVRQGDKLSVIFFIKNTGNMASKDITLKNIIPEGTSFIEGSFISQGAYMDEAEGQAVIGLEKAEPGKRIFLNYSLAVNSGLSDNTKLFFTPYISYSGKQASLKNQELTVRAMAEISGFSLTGIDENGGDLLPNETIKYTVYFKNAGDGATKNLVIENTIPPYTSLLETSLDQERMVWEKENEVFRVNVSELGPGEEFSFYYRVKIDGGLYYGTKITNKAALLSYADRLTSSSVTHTVISNYYYNVVVLGDSQVAQTTWVERLNAMFEENYLYGSFRFIKSGVNGETAVTGYNRMLDSGILKQNPYIFIINYGTNDAFTGSDYYRTSPEAFRHYLGAMIDTVKTNTGALVVVMSTGVSNEELHPHHKNSSLSMYNNIASQVTSEHGAVFVDVFSPLIKSENPYQYLADGLHYNGKGDQLVAEIAFDVISKYLNEYGTR